MVFKGGCPSELFTPQETVREKPPQQKIGPTDSCVVDPFAKKQTVVATCTYTVDVPDSTMGQPKELPWNHKLHNCFIKRASISIAKIVFKGGCPSELFTPQETVRENPPQLKIGPTAVEG